MANSDPRHLEKLFHRVTDTLRGQGGFILVTIGGAIAALGAIPTLTVWALIVGGLMLLAGILLHLLLKPNYAQLAKLADDERARAESSADALQGALESILRRIAKHCAVDQSHQRISIYCHVDREFVMLARESSSTVLGAHGRGTYPESQGVIGEAWNVGESTRRDWPEDREAWNEWQCDEYGMDRPTVENLTMHTRSIAARRLTHDHEHVGVIVMESTEPRGVRRANVTAAASSMLLGSVCEILRSAQPHFPAVAAYLKTQVTDS